MNDVRQMTEGNVASRRDRNLKAIRQKGGDIAEEMLVSQGFEALTARGLAKAIGCSVGALYNAFGHIDGVVREVNLRSARMLETALRAALAQEAQSLEVRLIASARTYFDFALTEQERWRALFDYPVRTIPDGRMFALQDELVAMLRDAAGVTDAESPQAVRLTLLWASVHGLTSLSARGNISGLEASEARKYLSVLVRSALDADLSAPEN